MIASARWVPSALGCAAALAIAARAAESAADQTVPGIVETTHPVFPPGLEASGFSYGEVHVAVKVDAAGKLDDLLVTAYTRRQFADEAVRAIRTWTFEPARAGGGPVGWVRNLQVYFRTDGARVVLDNFEHPAGKLLIFAGSDDHFNYRACALRDLDRIPVPRNVVAPEGHPQRSSGPVVIEFYIDEQGHVRMPGVREGRDAGFANAALAAVAQWQFDPPTRRGIPVLVFASQTFRVVPPVAPGRTGP